MPRAAAAACAELRTLDKWPPVSELMALLELRPKFSDGLLKNSDEDVVPGAEAESGADGSDVLNEVDVAVNAVDVE